MLLARRLDGGAGLVDILGVHPDERRNGLVRALLLTASRHSQSPACARRGSASPRTTRRRSGSTRASGCPGASAPTATSARPSTVPGRPRESRRQAVVTPPSVTGA